LLGKGLFEVHHKLGTASPFSGFGYGVAVFAEAFAVIVDDVGGLDEGTFEEFREFRGYHCLSRFRLVARFQTRWLGDRE
jgi:hypothetical protein